jgi:preprotein translocase subunit SecY
MRGIGNGVSLLIATGIIVNLPNKFFEVFRNFFPAAEKLKDY